MPPAQPGRAVRKGKLPQLCARSREPAPDHRKTPRLGQHEGSCREEQPLSEHPKKPARGCPPPSNSPPGRLCPSHALSPRWSRAGSGGCRRQRVAAGAALGTGAAARELSRPQGCSGGTQPACCREAARAPQPAAPLRSLEPVPKLAALRVCDKQLLPVTQVRVTVTAWVPRPHRSPRQQPPAAQLPPQPAAPQGSSPPGASPTRTEPTGGPKPQGSSSTATGSEQLGSAVL